MHTPGPWKIQRYKNYYGFSIYAAGRGCIAERWYEKKQDEEYANEINANALLIKAAPNLLEACKAMIRISDLWIPAEISVDHINEAQALHMAREKLLTAIAEAEPTTERVEEER